MSGSASELACVYASLILHDDGLDISADNINTLVNAAGLKIEPYWASLFSKLFANKNVGDLIANVGAGGGGGGVVSGGGSGGGGAAAAGGGAAKEEEKEEEKKEEEEEEDDDMGFSLFD
ncbi:hypothetical protein WJX81_004771 [Elliptochloris bilobata]|uniref:60S acidic ribosomal protein P1 n=1 Tax=Elliptochloris bilobata TaxID=381761 RepID=A0AAW1RBH9_9CHLO